MFENKQSRLVERTSFLTQFYDESYLLWSKTTIQVERIRLHVFFSVRFFFISKYKKKGVLLSSNQLYIATVNESATREKWINLVSHGSQETKDK